MGKLGKKRKRQLQQKAAVGVLHGRPDVGRLMVEGKEEGEYVLKDEDSGEGVTAEAFATTMGTLTTLLSNPHLLRQHGARALRAVLHPLAAHLKGGAATASLSSQVTSALEDGRWDDAVVALDKMAATNARLKLGSLQRWVHACALDTIHAYDPTALRVLDSIIRASSVGELCGATKPVSDPESTSGAGSGSGAGAGAGSAPPPSSPSSPSSPSPAPPTLPPPSAPGGGGTFVTHPPWAPTSTPLSPAIPDTPPPAVTAAAAAAKSFVVVAREKAAERRPPNKFDLSIVASPPGVVSFGPDSADIRRLDMPSVPGVFAMPHVLSPLECQQIIAAAEAVGYTPDQPLNRSSSASATRAATVAWLVDDSITRVIMRRCAPHLPPTYSGGKLVGLNARWRLYKYSPGNVYGPHIDGAWPGSGVDSDGKYKWDAYGDRWSRLTFLMYLNDDFSGGTTTYFTPDAKAVGTLHGRSVQPRAGTVVCFPHGEAHGALVHEGSLVTKGYKYIVRSDVLYMVDAKVDTRHAKTNREQDLLRAVADKERDADKDEP